MYSFLSFEPVHCSMSSSKCCFLTQIQVSQEADKLVWYTHLCRNFSQFFVIHTFKGFTININFLEDWSCYLRPWLWAGTRRDEGRERICHLLHCFLCALLKVFSTFNINFINYLNSGHRTRKESPQDWKRSVFIPIPQKGNPKECSNYRTIVLISHASKVMHKILQARLQQYVNRELPDVQAGFRKGRGTRDQIANICWTSEKAREFHKNIYLLYWLRQSLWLCGSQ